MDEKEILSVVLDCLNDAMTAMRAGQAHLEDDGAHADIYWEIKDISDVLVKRIQCVASEGAD